jgi:hypothetical protein
MFRNISGCLSVQAQDHSPGIKVGTLKVALWVVSVHLGAVAGYRFYPRSRHPAGLRLSLSAWPVADGICRTRARLAASSFHRHVRLGVLPQDWGGDVRHDNGRFGELNR